MTERAVAIKIDGIEWSAGAPQPVLLQSETRAFIAFHGRTDQVEEDEVVVAEFISATSIKAGFPNDEVLHGHRLWGHGLEFYSTHEVFDSSWLKELRAIESAHPQSSPVPFPDARHFVLAFHDSTVEAIARDLVLHSRHRSMMKAVSSLGEAHSTQLPFCTSARRPRPPIGSVVLLHRNRAAVQRGLIALDRITERSLCVADDEQNAGYRVGLGRCGRRRY